MSATDLDPGNQEPDNRRSPLDFPESQRPGSVPPPPAFGTVLDAPPPPRSPTPSPTASRTPWLAVGLAFAGVAALATVGTFVLLGSGDESDASVADPRPAAAVAAGPSALAVDVPPPATVAARSGPCPEGMVHVTGGKFFMGTDRDVAVLVPAHPAHQVEVEAYCISVHEVTVADYRDCSDQGECKRAYRTSEWTGSSSADAELYGELCNERYDDRGDHPVNCVTWSQAQHYCEWTGGRLPTEAEWEFAARGSDGRIYPWGDEAPDVQHMNGCGAECRTWRAAKGLPETPGLLYDASDKYPGTAPVGSFAAGRTQWGLDDIAGNVFEWTADVYRPYQGAEPQAAADGDTRRVIRGGAFNSFVAEHADPALRFGQDEQAHTHGIGFRCAAAVQ